jgi:hypothetical protein
MQVILDFLWFGLIFGFLATAPIITWLAAMWLLTDRRRGTTSPGQG